MLSCRKLVGAAALASALAVMAPAPQAVAGQSLIELVDRLNLQEAPSTLQVSGTSADFPDQMERYGWFASDDTDTFFMRTKDLKKTLKRAGVKLKKGFTIDVTHNGDWEAAGKKGKHYLFTADEGGHDQRILFDVFDKQGNRIAQDVRIQLNEGALGGKKKAKGFHLNEGSTTYTFDQLVSAFGVYDNRAPKDEDGLVDDGVNPIIVAGIESKRDDLQYVIDYDNRTVTFLGAGAKKKYAFSIWFNDTYGDQNKTYWKVDVKTGKVVASPSA